MIVGAIAIAIATIAAGRIIAIVAENGIVVVIAIVGVMVNDNY